VCGGNYSHSAYYSHQCTGVDEVEDEEFSPRFSPIAASGSSTSSHFEVTLHQSFEDNSLAPVENMDGEPETASLDFYESGTAASSLLKGSAWNIMHGAAVSLQRGLTLHHGSLSIPSCPALNHLVLGVVARVVNLAQEKNYPRLMFSNLC